MMDIKTITCPFCGTEIPEGMTECPNCHENLVAWTRVQYSHAIDYNEALAMAREGRLDEARARLGQVLLAKESFAPAHVLLAKISAQQGRWTDAERSAQRALELVPDDSRAAALAKAIAQARSDPASEGQGRESGGLAEAGVGIRHGGVPGSMVLGPHWLGRYQQDIVRAFAVGVGLTTVMALLISRLSGRRQE